MGVWDDRKVTPGITELSRPRVHIEPRGNYYHQMVKRKFVFNSHSDGESLKVLEHIDGAVCYIDVGSTYPGRAEAAKGGGVHPSKGIVSWVHNAVRQLVWYLLEMLMSERKDHPVREERWFDATGLPVIQQGIRRAATR